MTRGGHKYKQKEPLIGFYIKIQSHCIHRYYIKYLLKHSYEYTKGNIE